MNQFNEVYEANKQLDARFDEQYHQHDPAIIRMNIVELCVEIGELANETRCFKYWSQKKASESTVILEELADCFLMTLCFCNYKHLVLPASFKQIEKDNINVVFQHLFYLASSLEPSLDEKIILDLLNHFIHLGYLLHFSDDDMIKACFHKIKIVEKRLQSDY